MAHLGLVALLVRDQGDGRRWVIVDPPGGQTGLLLARADGPAQEAWIGDLVGFFHLLQLT